MLKIIFLGTSGALPSKERNPSAVMVNREGELLLFDCGEGAQQQMMRAKTGMVKISSVFLSHFHGDHIFGLPGLLQTMAFFEREEELTVYGPAGIHGIMDAFKRLGVDKLKYPLKVVELFPGDVIEKEEYTIKAVRADHDCPALGFVLEEKERVGRFNREKAVELGVTPGPAFARLHRGENVILEDGTVVSSKDVVGPKRPGRKIAYSGDTRETDVFFFEARGADVLIHEATFTSELKENAFEWGHSTARGVAEKAKEYGVRRLILTHISPRFNEEVDLVLEDALAGGFLDVVLAEDLMEVDVEYRDE